MNLLANFCYFFSTFVAIVACQVDELSQRTRYSYEKIPFVEFIHVLMA